MEIKNHLKMILNLHGYKKIYFIGCSVTFLLIKTKMSGVKFHGGVFLWLLSMPLYFKCIEVNILI